ncbi:histone H1-like [Tasmannia lanceolata]|uniref:histone H1-like n=1 Tax=Tasmannia lanceolata TaxID=3420 RepID=UPI00406424C0
MAKDPVPNVKPKPKSTSQKKPNSKPTKLPSAIHPPYFQMITEAISSLKDRTGSSQPAIAKFMEEKYKKELPPNFKKILSIQLKKFMKSEKLVKVKNSYKISASEKVKKVSVEVKEKKKEKDSKKVMSPKKVDVKKVKKSVGVKEKPKMKRLSKVSTPIALKKKVSTPKKVPKSIKGSKPASKKTRV